MFGFKERKVVKPEKQSPESKIKGLLATIVEQIDSNQGVNAIKSIVECDKLISDLPAVHQSKISISWGGVMGMVNMLLIMPEPVANVQMQTTLPMIKIHVMNTLGQLS